MDSEIRAELEKMHGRINEVKDRVTILETTIPYISAALARIQGGVDKLVWAVAILFLGAFVKFIIDGGLS